MKKVLLLFAVLMAIMHLACTEQVTGTIMTSDSNEISLAATQLKSVNTFTIGNAGGVFPLMALSDNQPKSNRC